MKRASVLLLSLLAAPCFAQELRPAEPSVLYYISVPFGGESRRDHEPVLGFALQGRHQYQSIRMDSRVLGLVGSGMVEAKVLIVGAVAAGAAIAMGSKDKSVEAQQAQRAEAERYVAANPPQPCPQTCFQLRRY